ncbi:MAG: MBL fold metallo-hydrolase [Clostridia bacterium]|nr:MBL fold metallo-hydrolase [Clostridia bacterium]
MARKKVKITKRIIALIVVAAVILTLSLALIITNFFVPVMYISAYAVSPVKNQAGVMRVSFVDVDFGDCTIVELPDGKTMLIDGGDGAYSNNLRLLKALNRRGIDKIDYLICTSVRDEHCGGLKEVVKYKQIGTAYLPYCINTRITKQFYNFVSELRAKSVETVYAGAGKGVDGGDYFFTFLSPATHLSDKSEYVELNKSPTNENIDNASVVTWLEFGNTSFTFCSDVRETALKRIISEYNLSLNTGAAFCGVGDKGVRLEECDVVTVAGHGAEKNSYAPWYEALKPKDAVISVGKNFAGCPSSAAIADVMQYTLRTPLITSENGEIIFKVTATDYIVDKEKK